MNAKRCNHLCLCKVRLAIPELQRHGFGQTHGDDGVNKHRVSMLEALTIVIAGLLPPTTGTLTGNLIHAGAPWSEATDSGRKNTKIAKVLCIAAQACLWCVVQGADEVMSDITHSLNHSIYTVDLTEP